MDIQRGAIQLALPFQLAACPGFTASKRIRCGGHVKDLLWQGKHSLAFDHFFRAASLGSASAQYMLGNYRRLGLGTWKDTCDAFACYQAAAKKGHPRAPWALGYCYETGTGIVRNLALARDWYAQAMQRLPDKAPDQQ